MECSYNNDKKKKGGGDDCEKFFKLNYLDRLTDVKLRDVSKLKNWASDDIDFLVTDKNNLTIKYEVKSSLNKKTGVETVDLENRHNCDPKYGDLIPGWMYTSKADVIVFVNYTDKEMLFIKFERKFKEYFKNFIKKEYDLIFNIPTKNNDGVITHQSNYYKVPTSILKDYTIKRICIKKKGQK